MHEIGMYFYQCCYRIDEMTEDSLDALCAKADAIDKMREELQALPPSVRREVEGFRP